MQAGARPSPGTLIINFVPADVVPTLSAPVKCVRPAVGTVMEAGATPARGAAAAARSEPKAPPFMAPAEGPVHR